jgi:hypothetical protein
MKCSFCTFDHQPTNPNLLKAHAEAEQVDGKTNGKVPVVVFRDGDFLIVEEALEGEQVYFFNIQDTLAKIEQESVVVEEVVVEEEPVEE